MVPEEPEPSAEAPSDRAREEVPSTGRKPHITPVFCSFVPPHILDAMARSVDEWAAAVRALVNVGRKPLAESLGLALPSGLEAERTVWGLVTKLSQLPYSERRAALDPYRSGGGPGA